MNGEATPDSKRTQAVEPRENRQPSYGENRAEQKDSDEEQKKRARAVYLIEREAIQLRRARWESLASPMSEGVTMSGLVDMARKQPSKPRVDATAVRLATYARPHKETVDESMLARSRRWFSSFGAKKKDGDQ